MNERQIYINGRFLSRSLTGVERVANEILSALVKILAERPELKLRLTVIAPKLSEERFKAAQLVCDRLDVPLVQGRTKGYLWEQIELPLRTAGDTLVSFCNLGPIFKRTHLVVIHDAQVYTQPDSYTRPFRTVYKILLPILGRMAKQVVAVSENTKKELEDFGVLPKGKARVIHNAADHILKVKPTETCLVEPPYFLVFGSQAPHKNVSAVRKAMTDFKHGDIPLVVAGGSNGRIFKGSEGNDVNGIKYLGRVSDQDLASLYKHATAFLFPSLTEGFGIPPLEAMHMGCPVVASSGGAIPEVCEDAALYVLPHDVAGWDGAIRKISGSATLRASMRRKGFKQAGLFSWEKAAAHYLDLIIGLARSERAESPLANVPITAPRSSPISVQKVGSRRTERNMQI